ncbi:MAG: PucR family transcriptional regulator ligand-binding domain-containing protein [Elainellaceae cyanobacterium]
MLTVREALAFPIFSSARLVAGKNGLHRIMQWLHVVDYVRAHYQWDREGVLLLTTGVGLYEEPELQQTLIPKLHGLGFCGLVLSTGHYFVETPEALRQQAEALDFPIIETPPDLDFIDITEAVLKHIVNQQYDLLQRSARFNQQLTDVVLQGADLNELAETMAGLLNRSIAIESTLFQVLAAAQRGAIDDVRAQSIKGGHAAKLIVDRLLQEGIYARLAKALQPIRLSPLPDVGMTMARIVAPIVVKREIHGYIWTIEGDEPLTPLDELAISHGATVAALILLKEQSMQQAAVALQGDFFAQLLGGKTDATTLKEQAQRIGYQLDCSHQVWMIRDPEAANAAHSTLEIPMRQWFTRQQHPFLLFPRDQSWVAVVECQTTQQGYEQAIALAESLAQTTPALVGVGNVSSSTGDADEISLQKSYEQAQEALQIAIAMGDEQGAIAFQNLGLLHWLYSLSPQDRAANVYLTHLETLRAYDHKRNGDLLKSLEAYLDYGGAVVEASTALHVHRNTLLHRLERIETLCQVDLKDPMQRLNLHVALKSQHLVQG